MIHPKTCDTIANLSLQVKSHNVGLFHFCEIVDGIVKNIDCNLDGQLIVSRE
jgi:hypothetical protein